MIDLPHDISTDSYVGAVERDKKKTPKNRYAFSFATRRQKNRGSLKMYSTLGEKN
ncbi:MAG: hypothetical protein CM1200mP30_15870 [Pseudomonadota bacterium]|nr:MAG: hypothetical protein CM1200mP30_15870 [Pseudomonadota bacterium]